MIPGSGGAGEVVAMVVQVVAELVVAVDQVVGVVVAVV